MDVKNLNKNQDFMKICTLTIHENLVQKYQEYFNFYQGKNIDLISEKIRSVALIEYNDYQIYDSLKEELRRFYI